MLGFWTGFFIGIFVGSFLGVIIMALMVAASRGDNYRFYRSGSGE